MQWDIGLETELSAKQNLNRYSGLGFCFTWRLGFCFTWRFQIAGIWTKALRKWWTPTIFSDARSIEQDIHIWSHSCLAKCKNKSLLLFSCALGGEIGILVLCTCAIVYGTEPCHRQAGASLTYASILVPLLRHFVPTNPWRQITYKDDLNKSAQKQSSELFLAMTEGLCVSLN